MATENFSIGEISNRLNVPIHRLNYVVRSRSIKPVCRLGNAWGWDEAGVKRITDELARIATKQSSSHPRTHI